MTEPTQQAGPTGQNTGQNTGEGRAPSPVPRRFTIPSLLAKTARGEKLTMLTAYDSTVAPLLAQGGVEMLLIGDSMGNVALGLDSTLPVSVADITAATAAVARSTSLPLIVADLPFGSYEGSDQQAFETSVALLKAGAQAVKLEGGAHRAPTVRFLVENGIPVMGHLGYTPQSQHTLGGPRLQGRGSAKRQELLDDALALERAGAFAVVLEMVPAGLAEEVTDQLKIPTIGIGAGPSCDGQVLVWADMAGMTEWTPSFVHRFAEVGTELQRAAASFVAATKEGSFPGPDNYRDD